MKKLIIRTIKQGEPAVTVHELNALQKMIERRAKERGLKDTHCEDTEEVDPRAEYSPRNDLP